MTSIFNYFEAVFVFVAFAIYFCCAIVFFAGVELAPLAILSFEFAKKALINLLRPNNEKTS